MKLIYIPNNYIKSGINTGLVGYAISLNGAKKLLNLLQGMKTLILQLPKRLLKLFQKKMTILQKLLMKWKSK